MIFCFSPILIRYSCYLLMIFQLLYFLLIKLLSICVLSIGPTVLGVPRGSSLGPILISLYINDFPLNIWGSKLVLYADDTNILVSGENLHALQHKLTNIVSELQLWFSSNNFVVSTDKTLVISFHTTQDKNPIRPHVTSEHNIIPYNTITQVPWYIY